MFEARCLNTPTRCFSGKPIFFLFVFLVTMLLRALHQRRRGKSLLLLPIVGSMWNSLANRPVLVAVRNIAGSANLPPKSAVPTGFRAAGVIFYTRTATGAVDKLLMGVECRKVNLKELGIGQGAGQRHVLLFPQGKREAEDLGYYQTASREFLEETGDPDGLLQYLKPSISPAFWWEPAKMAVIFCEVPPLAASLADPIARHQGAADRSPSGALPVMPLWLHASVLGKAMETGTASDALVTPLGDFPLFPMTRRFFKVVPVWQWLRFSQS